MYFAALVYAAQDTKKGIPKGSTKNKPAKSDEVRVVCGPASCSFFAQEMEEIEATSNEEDVKVSPGGPIHF